MTITLYSYSNLLMSIKRFNNEFEVEFIYCWGREKHGGSKGFVKCGFEFFKRL